MTSRVDVSIEHKHEPPPGDKHPNTCPKCHSHYREDELIANLRVCAHCGHHFRLSARERIEQLFDEGSFVEEAAELRSADPLGFFDLKPYSERIAEAELKTGLGDAMVIGSGKIEGRPCELSVMDFRFMGGSMGSVVGEKFVRACEAACSRGVPLVSVTSSGGARMQEGVLSLLQLPKTICAIDALRESRCALLTIMADPTTAGATASFATLGDVTVAESGALVAFTGPRVVQQTIREDLPADFGLAESNFRFGQLDAVVPRQEVRPLLGRLLRLFGHDK
ncbi:MAG: acetyl-CoA carboxylase carboxyltransferase subunit beta [Gaiellaceae bacterium]